MGAKPHCKLCGARHWSYEGHDQKGIEAGLAKLGLSVTPVVTDITEAVTRAEAVDRKVQRRVTPPVTLVTPRATGVTPTVTDVEHACPACGHLHRPRTYETNAARQRAYRERKARP